MGGLGSSGTQQEYSFQRYANRQTWPLRQEVYGKAAQQKVTCSFSPERTQQQKICKLSFYSLGRGWSQGELGVTTGQGHNSNPGKPVKNQKDPAAKCWDSRQVTQDQIDSWDLSGTSLPEPEHSQSRPSSKIE